jgi:precorrin-2 dehydrogenase / sirohydrochlorin ferrochelatase
MKYYPAYLDISKRTCIVVGGGNVAHRKVKTLLECGASVTVISPELTDGLSELARQKKILWKNRPYENSDLAGAFLAIGATSDQNINGHIKADAKRTGALCNIADQPALCDFILPSLVKRGDLVIAVSTTGKSPAYAKELKKQMESCLGEEHALFLELMGAIRKKRLTENKPSQLNKSVFKKLVDAGLVEMIRDNHRKTIDETLADILGPGYDYKSLMDP